MVKFSKRVLLLQKMTLSLTLFLLLHPHLSHLSSFPDLFRVGIHVFVSVLHRLLKVDKSAPMFLYEPFGLFLRLKGPWNIYV